MPLTIDEHEQAMREHETACGAAIIAWTTLEAVLVFYFQSAAQIGDQFRARMIWASLPNLQARRKLLNRFAENYIEDEKVLRCYRILMKRLSRLSSKRNMIAHTSSGVIMESGKVLFNQFDFGEEDGVFLFLKQVTYDRENVKNWAHNIRLLWADMVNFLPTFSKAIHTSSRMHRELQNDRTRNIDPRQSESTPEER